jgi:hypothetical protein
LGGEGVDGVYRFDFGTERLSKMAKMNEKRVFWSQMPVIGGEIYAIGGNFEGNSTHRRAIIEETKEGFNDYSKKKGHT